MGQFKPSIEARLNEIMTELQAEFEDLRGHAAGFSGLKQAQLDTLAEKIDFARYCIQTAVRVVEERRVRALFERDRIP